MLLTQVVSQHIYKLQECQPVKVKTINYLSEMWHQEPSNQPTNFVNILVPDLSAMKENLIYSELEDSKEYHLEKMCTQIGEYLSSFMLILVLSWP